MSFKTATDNFSAAQQVAEASDNSAMEFVTAGLIELTKAIKSDLAAIKSKTDGIENKVKSLR